MPRANPATAKATAILLILTISASVRAETAPPDAPLPSGGLAVFLGGDAGRASELAETGRFVVQVLHDDGATVDALREAVQAKGVYGLVSVDELDGTSRLPYTENLVNVLFVADGFAEKVPPAEIARVLCPRGVACLAGPTPAADVLAAAGLESLPADPAAGGLRLARKPWPAEMDDWPHPRHGADGNPVSGDKLVGPPRRVR
jgi:hypothetical protein